MRRFFLHFIPLALVGLAGLLVAAPAQEKAVDVKLLENFFDLGLPEVKGGKWSRVLTMDSENGESLPATRNAQYSGNAWLMRDERGVIEAVTFDGRVIRGKKVSSDTEPVRDEGGLPQAQVQTADLDGDLKIFMAALKSGDSRRSRGEDDAQAAARGAGGALIFLAQLQRQGRGDFVRGALPLVFAKVPSPDLALDGAVSLIADGRLASLSRTWAEKGDAAAYAAGIEKLAATFPRGWSHRDAALFLAAGLREQKASPPAGDNDARLAAKLLLGLKPAQFRELPTGRNWFIAGARGRSGRGGFPGGFPGLEGFDGADGADGADDAGQPAKKSPEITAFFADKRAAALALAKLLDDRRYLRTATRTDDGSSGFSRFSSGGRKSQEQIVREQYARLPRPPELGEIAWTLLSPLLPEGVREAAEEKPESRAASALLWVKGAAAKNDEEIAWDYLRSSQQTYQDEFSASLGFLVEKGGADTLVKLREVFLDPAVWSGGVDQIAEPLGKFIKRAPADPAFADKLRAAVKSALDAQEADQRRYSSGRSAAQFAQQFAAQRTAQMKRLDQLFKPPQPVAEQLAEIAAMEETEALAALSATGEMLAKKPLAEIESPVFQAAAKAKSPALKQQTIQILMGAVMNGMQARALAKGGTAPPVPADAPTREALLALLRDETPLENDWDLNAKSTVADFTGAILLALHSGPAAQEQWQKLGTSVPHLATKWMHTHAVALASGQPLPPLPNAANVPADTAVALVREIGALTAKDVPAALEKRPPDEQLAIVAQLAKMPAWPASLAEARFTVSEVFGKSARELGAGDWQGRRFDEKLLHEIDGAVVHAAASGKFHLVAIRLTGPLSGVAISVEASGDRPRVPPLGGNVLSGLSEKPAPVGSIFIGIGYGQESMVGGWMGFAFPVWKDEAATRSWREAHGKPKPGPKQSDEAVGREIRADPAPFEAKLRDCLSLKEGTRGLLQLVIQASAISKDDE